jgi:hypothetical protein
MDKEADGYENLWFARANAMASSRTYTSKQPSLPSVIMTLYLPQWSHLLPQQSEESPLG